VTASILTTTAPGWTRTVTFSAESPNVMANPIRTSAGNNPRAQNWKICRNIRTV
jgi:hypothetical protein